MNWGLLSTTTICPSAVALDPPAMENIVQWLKGDTFEEEGTTYMRDYSGNELHAIVIDADNIIQPIDPILYSADVPQAFWYTDSLTPNTINISELQYDIYDENSYHITFADVGNPLVWKDIITYSTPLDGTNLTKIYKFINDKILRDSTGQALQDENGEIIYIL